MLLNLWWYMTRNFLLIFFRRMRVIVVLDILIMQECIYFQTPFNSKLFLVWYVSASIYSSLDCITCLLYFVWSFFLYNKTKASERSLPQLPSIPYQFKGKQQKWNEIIIISTIQKKRRKLMIVLLHQPNQLSWIVFFNL